MRYMAHRVAGQLVLPFPDGHSCLLPKPRPELRRDLVGVVVPDLLLGLHLAPDWRAVVYFPLTLFPGLNDLIPLSVTDVGGISPFVVTDVVCKGHEDVVLVLPP